jgi:hypothetical protein
VSFNIILFFGQNLKSFFHFQLIFFNVFELFLYIMLKMNFIYIYIYINLIFF